jgi:hypothetical protein
MTSESRIWIPAFAGMTLLGLGGGKNVTPAKAGVQRFLLFVPCFPFIIPHSSFIILFAGCHGRLSAMRDARAPGEAVGAGLIKPGPIPAFFQCWVSSRSIQPAGLYAMFRPAE